VLTALRELGPATASEIAHHIGASSPANVSTRLRQLEQKGKVRRTGKMVNPQGARGGPQIEWELMPANGATTGVTTQLHGSGPVEERLRRMAEQIGRANGHVERLENELEAAKARAEQAERRAGDSERRRQEAERRAANVPKADQSAELKSARDDAEALRGELADAQRRIRELEERPSQDGAERIAVAERATMRQRYFDLLLEQARQDATAEHVYDRVERLIDGGEF
jgi:DNA-binding Lrp family transcriptional regulator